MHQHAHSKHRVFIIALVIILAFAMVEFIGGWLAHSLALISDAGHMATDSVALALAGFASWISVKPASRTHSYGFGRAEVIAAWFSSLLMIALTIWIVIEAIERLQHPHPVAGLTVIVIAFIGLGANVVVACLLSHGEQNLNKKAALLHVMGDLLGSVVALIAGAVIFFSGWMPIDPILSLFISMLILIASIKLLRQSLRILMEAVPTHIDLQQVVTTLKQIPTIQNVHDLHVWTLSSGEIMMSAHLITTDLTNWPTTLQDAQQRLLKAYNISHATLQPELEQPHLTQCKKNAILCSQRKLTPHGSYHE